MDMNGYVEDQFDVDMLEEGLFDNIEDIMDFSNDDNVFLGEVESCFHDPPPPPPPPAAAEAATPTFPCSSEDVGSGLTATSEENGLCDELNIPEDWLNLLDDTNFTLDLPPSVSIAIPNNDCIIKNDSLFRSSSPVSVLEQSILNGNVVDGSESGSGSGSGSGSSSSSSNSINNEIDIVSLPPISPPGPTIPSIPARARTKRHRPATFARRVNVTIPPLPPSLDSLPALPEEIGNIAMKKKKKIKKCPPFFGSDEGIAVRKCVHCGIQKTPQWRAGPTGPKTLCNACGVRYKSGRLFPEYRPAASPTFVASVHSNSHKKVVEMRIRASREDADAIMPKASPALKNCDLVAYIRRKD